MADTYLTIVGNLTSDAELRFTPSGAAVANFTVASTPRSFDKRTNDFKDGETLFQRCNVWREQAENVAESLTKGTEVIVYGKLKSRSYETKTGEKRTTTELEVEHVGPSLRKNPVAIGGRNTPQQSQEPRGSFNGGFGSTHTRGFGTSPQNGTQRSSAPTWESDEESPF